MAELGVAAAILQIAQLTVQVALKTNSIASKLKHAPRVISCNLRSVHDFIHTLRTLESALTVVSVGQPGIRDVLTDESRRYIQELLQHCNEEATSCDSLLLPIVPQDGRMWKEAWKRILSIKREEEITQRLSNLDSLRSQLTIWYNHQLMLLTCRVHLSVTNVDDRLQSLHQEVSRGLTTFDSSVTAIDKLANEICNRLSLRPSLLADLAHNVYQPRMPSHRGCRCQQMKKRTIDLNYKFVSYQSRSFEDHRPGCPYFGRNLAKRYESRLRFSLLSHCIDITLARPPYLGHFIIISIVDELTSPTFERFRHAQNEIYDTLSEFRHESQELEDRMRQKFFDCPRPLVGSVTGVKLSKVKRIMQELLEELVEDLQIGKYSARDQSAHGLTLLHAYCRVLIYVWSVQAELHELIKETVGLLVYHGADVNAMSREFAPRGLILWVPTLGTALNLSLQRLEPQRESRMGSDVSIPLILSQYGMDAFCGKTASAFDFLFVDLFVKAPDLALEYGCSQLAVAVAQRNQYEVERLIRNRHDVNDTISPPFSPLCLAIGWNTGVGILLEAGADPSTAVHCAIFYEDEVSLRTLLDHGMRRLEDASEQHSSSLLAKDVDVGPPHLQPQEFQTFNNFPCLLLSFALWRERVLLKPHHNIISLIVQALAALRQKLMDLAQKYLSVSELKQCGWNDAFNNVLVSDAVATALATSLHDKNVDVIPALCPSRQSVYHNKWMTEFTANELLLAGFKQIDLPDELGRTPLLVNAHFTKGRIMERIACLNWFLQNGAEHVMFPYLNGKSLAHVLAANLGNAWFAKPPWEGSYGNWDLCQEAKAYLPALLTRIFSLLASPGPDNCRCFCSQSGCLPVHDLLKQVRLDHRQPSWPTTLWPTWYDEKKVLDLWSQCSSMSPEKGLERSEICRLQVFNRLSMKHTCCVYKFEFDFDFSDCVSKYSGLELLEMNDSEQEQLREEDVYAKSQLDAIMTLYHELKAEYWNQSDAFWEIWWSVLEGYIPSVNWLEDWNVRHVQIHDDLFPIEEHELQPRIDRIREEVRASMTASLRDAQEDKENEESEESEESEENEESEEIEESEEGEDSS